MKMGSDDDKYWFGVDRAGCVAAFRGGRTGAAPRGAFDDEQMISSFGLFRFLSGTGYRCDPVLDFRGSFRPDQETPPGRHALRHRRTTATLGRYHVFVRTLESILSWLHSGEGRAVAGTEGAAAAFAQLSSNVARALYDSHALLGALPRPEVSDPFPADVIASLGVYVYEHLCDGWIAGPYGRIALPDRPIRVTGLPVKVAESPALARFERCDFAETVYFQPCEWTDCSLPGNQYLGSDFSTVRSV